MSDDKVYKATVAFSGTAKFAKCDVVMHEGQPWLVARWLHNATTGESQPIRLIPLRRLKHQATPGGKFGDYVVNAPIPKSLFDASPISVELANEFGVLHSPDITRRLPRGMN